MAQGSAGGPKGESDRGLVLSPSLMPTSEDSSSTTSPAESERTGGRSAPSSTGAPWRRWTRIYAIAGVVIVLVVILAAYALTGGFHHSSGSGPSAQVLVTDGTGYPITNGQFNGIAFIINSTSVIQGEINSSRGVVLDIMTPTQFEHLVKALNVSGYEWTSGVVADQTIYDVDITVAPGQWYLAFLDPSPYLPTGVGFYSDLTLTPT